MCCRWTPPGHVPANVGGRASERPPPCPRQCGAALAGDAALCRPGRRPATAHHHASCTRQSCSCGSRHAWARAGPTRCPRSEGARTGPRLLRSDATPASQLPAAACALPALRGSTTTARVLTRSPVTSQRSTSTWTWGSSQKLRGGAVALYMGWAINQGRREGQVGSGMRDVRSSPGCEWVGSGRDVMRRCSEGEGLLLLARAGGSS